MGVAQTHHSLTSPDFSVVYLATGHLLEKMQDRVRYFTVQQRGQRYPGKTGRPALNDLNYFLQKSNRMISVGILEVVTFILYFYYDKIKGKKRIMVTSR